MVQLLDLTKSLELNLQKANFVSIPKMAVKLAVDKSGSMRYEFQSGWVQDTIDLFLAAAMKFDDDGVMEIGFFNSEFERTPDVTAADAGVYIRNEGIYVEGGTEFSGAVSQLGTREKKGGFFGFGGKVDTSHPIYIALITDGENQDKYETETALSRLENTFVQVVAIGNGVDRRYLDTLHRQFSHVSVIYMPDPSRVDSDKFYELLLNEELKKFAGC